MIIEGILISVGVSKGLDVLVKLFLDTFVFDSTSPSAIILVGPVNAGKSTVLRALSGFDGGNISPLEGEYHEPVAIENGDGIVLVDMPGILDAADCERGRTERPAAVILVVSDRLDSDVLDEMKRLRQQYPHMVYVRTKIDLVHPGRRKDVLDRVRQALRDRDLSEIPVVGVCGGPRGMEAGNETAPEGIRSLRRALAKKLKAAGREAEVAWAGRWTLASEPLSQSGE